MENVYLQFVVVAGSGLGGISILLLAVIIYLRWRTKREEVRRNRVGDRWELLVEEWPEKDQASSFSNADRVHFLALWNEAFEEADRAKRKQFLAIAEYLNLSSFVKTNIDSYHRRRYQPTILAAGFLGLNELSGTLKDICSGGGSFPSVLAARSLVEMEAEDAVEFVLDGMLNRPDWPIPRVEFALQPVPPEPITEPLLSRLRSEEGENRSRMMNLLHLAEPEPARSFLVKSLGNSPGDEEAADALRELARVARREDRPVLDPYLNAEAPFLRSLAVGVLGSIGNREDFDLLHNLLGDPDYWVRYRSALAMMDLDGVEEEEVKRILENHEDRFARDMLRQVIYRRDVQGS